MSAPYLCTVDIMKVNWLIMVKSIMFVDYADYDKRAFKDQVK